MIYFQCTIQISNIIINVQKALRPRPTGQPLQPLHPGVPRQQKINALTQRHAEEGDRLPLRHQQHPKISPAHHLRTTAEEYLRDRRDTLRGIADSHQAPLPRFPQEKIGKGK